MQVQAFSQTSLRDNLKKFTADVIAKAIKKQHIKKISFWDFTDINKETQPVGTYISELMSVYANDIDSVLVMDRMHLKTILQEHQLKSEGFIDQNTIMQLGKFSDVNAVVVGTIILNENGKDFQLMVKVLTTNEAITASSGEETFPIDDKISSVVGIKVNNSDNQNSSPNRGFNRPINSNEQYNNAATVNRDCDKNNTGDYCFYNSTKSNVRVFVDYYTRLVYNGEIFGEEANTTFILKSGESKCVYEILANPGKNLHTFNMNRGHHFRVEPGVTTAADIFNGTTIIDEGDFIVEKCKSKTYTIK